MRSIVQRVLIFAEKSLYCVLLYNMHGDGTLKVSEKNERIREHLIVTMLEEFPTLKKKIRIYLEETSNRQYPP